MYMQNLYSYTMMLWMIFLVYLIDLNLQCLSLESYILIFSSEDYYVAMSVHLILGYVVRRLVIINNNNNNNNNQRSKEHLIKVF